MSRFKQETLKSMNKYYHYNSVNIDKLVINDHVPIN